MKKRNGPWWVFALAAVCCWALGLAWIPLHLESPDGLDVMAALVLLALTLLPAWKRARFHRWQGAALLAFYGGYVALLFRTA